MALSQGLTGALAGWVELGSHPHTYLLRASVPTRAEAEVKSSSPEVNEGPLSIPKSHILEILEEGG